MNRLQAEYKDFSKTKFITNKHERNQQYFSIYNYRIKMLFSQTMSYAKYLLNGEYKDKYQNVEYLYSTVELNKDEFEDSIVVVIGTLFKEGKKKPSILDEYTRDVCIILLSTFSFTADHE